MDFSSWLSQPAVFPWVALALGLCIGSFLNVVIHRLPKMMEREWLVELPAIIEESESLKNRPEAKRLADQIKALIKDIVDKPAGLVMPRSHCPSCGHAIRACENVPVLSYLALRGRCSNCHTKISLRYPAIELLAGLGAFYCATRFGFGWKSIAAVIFLWATIALAAIDEETGILPDSITLPLLWFGLLVNLRGTFIPLEEAVIGAAAGYLFLWGVNGGFRLIRGMDGMGYGDFKLTAAVGAFLGWKVLLLVILLSSFVGLFFGSLQMIAAKRGWDAKFQFHFGPYLAVAGLIAMFWGQAIFKRYPSLDLSRWPVLLG